MMEIESTKRVDGVLFVMLVHTPTGSAYEMVFDTVLDAQLHINILNNQAKK